MLYIYTSEYYSVIKKNEIMSFAATLNGSRDCHTEWRQSDREGEILYDIPYLKNLKRNDTSEFIKQKQTHRLRQWIYLQLPGGRTGSKLGKEYVKAVSCNPVYLTYMQSTSCKMLGWVNHKLESNLPEGEK